MIGGFGRAGQPVELIDALIAQGAGDLTIVNNNAGNGDTGLAALLAAKQVRKIICSFPRQHDSWVFDGLYRAGEIELEIVPQGNLAERIRAAGAGIGAFFSPTGVGTRARRGQGGPHDRGPRLRARVPDPRRLRADQRAARPTGGATSSTARPRATSGRSWRPPRRRRSCRSMRSCRSDRSIPRRRDPGHLRGPRRRGGRARLARRRRVRRRRRPRGPPDSTSRRSERRRTDDHPHQPRRARAAHRRRHPRGLVREPRHRRADAGGELPARRPGDHPAHRERHARHGPGAGCRARRPRPHQRRQAGGDRAARRRVLPPRRLVRHDARRPPRRLRARRVPGVADRRPRELVDRARPARSPPSAARWTSRSAPSRST